MSTIMQQIEAIKAAANIVEVVGNFETLKRKGRHMFCKCPLHGEHTASFAVKPSKNTFHCYGCGAGSSPADFIMQHLGLEYMQALKWLADFYNLPLDEATPRTYKAPARRIARPTAQVNAPLPSFINETIFEASLQRYDQNNLAQFLHTLFEPEVVQRVIDEYCIGSSAYYIGGCVFWQIDESGKIRGGKVMPYDATTGKRIRETIIRDGKELPPTNWVHSILKDYDYNLQQCFYGSHLLCDDSKHMPVAIVESEKTATIASVFIPSFLWLSLGKKGHTKYNVRNEINHLPDGIRDMFKPLQGRKIVLFPDFGAVEDWQHMAAELSAEHDITVCDLLGQVEHLLPPKADLCDWLISEHNRSALIDRFKHELINNPPATIAEGIATVKGFIAIGLRRKDIDRAEAEILNEYAIEPEQPRYVIGLKKTAA